MLLLVTLCLCIGQTAVVADEPAEEGDWNNDNSIFAEIKSEYVDEVLEDVSGAFSDLLDLQATYITQKVIYDDEYRLNLRLVLNNGSKAELDAAIAKLTADKRVKSAEAFDDVPFETINTMSLSASSYTVKVGDTITVKPEGELKIYEPTVSFDSILVSLENYDPEKEYTPDDFPQFELASVEKLGTTGGCFVLTLENPGYFNVHKALHEFALDSAFIIVEPNGLCHEDWVLFSEWSISDTLIADFFDKEPFHEYKEATIKGLKPGIITLTYVQSMGYYLAEDYPVSCEITVTEPDITPETTQPNQTPITGDTYPTAMIILTMLLAISVVLVLTKAKRRAF